MFFATTLHGLNQNRIVIFRPSGVLSAESVVAFTLLKLFQRPFIARFITLRPFLTASSDRLSFSFKSDLNELNRFQCSVVIWRSPLKKLYSLAFVRFFWFVAKINKETIISQSCRRINLSNSLCVLGKKTLRRFEIRTCFTSQSLFIKVHPMSKDFN